MKQDTVTSPKKLRNAMEYLIARNIDEVLDHYPNMCKCSECLLDISALALNSLPVRYIVTDSGEIYNKIEMLNSQFRVDVITALSKAAAVVTENPHHNANDSEN